MNPIPESHQTETFHFRVLSPEDVEMDYDAVKSSIAYLRELNPFGPNNDWPPENLSLEENLTDLKEHKKEFDNKEAFAYMVTNPQEDQCIGCVYIYPSPAPEHDAKVILWTRESQKNLDHELYTTVKNWLQSDWHFQNPAFPGREHAWEKF